MDHEAAQSRKCAIHNSRIISPRELLESQLFEELQSHSGLDDPHPQSPLTPTRFGPPSLTRFRPEFDPSLTPNRPKRSELGQIQVNIGSERGSKSGRGEWGLGVGVIRPEWLCSSFEKLQC